MGRCPDARELLPAYVENELTAAEQLRVRGHLEICSACRSEEIAYRNALGALTAAPKPAHGDLYAGLAAKIDRLERRPVFQPRRLRWAGALACLVLAVSVGAMVAGPRLFGTRSIQTPPTGRNPSPPAPAIVGQQHNGALSSGIARTAPNDAVAPNVSAESTFQPIQLPDDTVTTTPERDQPKERVRRHSSRQQRSPRFEDIVDSRGRSVKDLMHELEKNQRISSAGPDHESPAAAADPNKHLPDKSDEVATRQVDIPSMPDVKVVVQEKEKHERDGETVVKGRRETGYDSNGQLALIHLKLKAEPAPARNSDNGDNSKHLRRGSADENN